MGARYLTDLAAVCRNAGLLVQEEPGWQTRSRSSGGYDGGLPNHVMVHHTASGPSSDGQPDVNYMTYGSDNRPVANLYLSRSGKVWVMAGGATNTNGSGRCPHCGTTDNMNTRAIGIEAGNDGVGEAWPAQQQTAYDQLVTALTAAYGIAVAATIAHFEYAPDRKVDPAGPSRWSNPTGGGSSNRWRMGDFRADLAHTPPTPIPPPDEEDLYVAYPYVIKNRDTGAAIVVEPAGLRSIGGAELNYLAANFDVVTVGNGTEWDMALAGRSKSVDVVGD
jgi:hypothetical protein